MEHSGSDTTKHIAMLIGHYLPWSTDIHRYWWLQVATPEYTVLLILVFSKVPAESCHQLRFRLAKMVRFYTTVDAITQERECEITMICAHREVLWPQFCPLERVMKVISIDV